MSKKKINLSDVQKEIIDSLKDYTAEVVEDSKKKVQQVGKETVAQLKEKSPKRSKEYSKSWKVKKVFENADEIKVRIYNEKYYRLTHLLEYGHAKRDGGRVDPIPHIRPAEEAAAKKLDKKVKVVIR